MVLQNASDPRINQYELNVQKNYMHKVAKDAFIPMKNVTKSRYTNFKHSQYSIYPWRYVLKKSTGRLSVPHMKEHNEQVGNS